MAAWRTAWRRAPPSLSTSLCRQVAQASHSGTRGGGVALVFHNHAYRRPLSFSFIVQGLLYTVIVYFLIGFADSATK